MEKDFVEWTLRRQIISVKILLFIITQYIMNFFKNKHLKHIEIIIFFSMIDYSRPF